MTSSQMQFHMKPPEGVKQPLCFDEWFIFWLTPLSKCTLSTFKLATVIILQIIFILDPSHFKFKYLLLSR